MKRVIIEVDAVVGRCFQHYVDLGPQTLHINGEGTKSIVVNSLNSANWYHQGYNLSNNNNSKSQFPFNLNGNNNTANGTNSRTAGAVIAANAAPFAIATAVDRCFVELGLVDTHVFLSASVMTFKKDEIADRRADALGLERRDHSKNRQFYTNTHQFPNKFFSWSNKDENRLDYYIKLIYKCAIIQHSNYVKAMRYFFPDECDELIPDVNDIKQTLHVWIGKLNFPRARVDERIRAFLNKITDTSVEKDYNKYKDTHHWQIRYWIDESLEHHCERLLRNQDDDQRCIRVNVYGTKDCIMRNIVTYDGQYCLRLPYDLRISLQGLYEANARQFKKTMMPILLKKFSDSIDANEESHSLSSFFLAFKKRNIKYDGRDYSEAVKHFESLIGLYPDQTDALKLINNLSKGE